MFKDYDKYLSESLKVYLIVLVCVFILKLVGLNYFGLDTGNKIINIINDFCLKYRIDYIWYFTILYIQLYLYMAIVTKNKDVKLVSLIGTITLSFSQLLFANNSNNNLYYFVISIIILILLPNFIDKSIKISRKIKFICSITIYQFISLIIRNANDYSWCFIIDTILNIDQLLLLLITYEISFLKGDLLCGQEVFLSSQKKMNLKKSLKRLQRNLHNFRKKDKEYKLTIVIYVVLSLLWNVFSLLVIILVAKLNNTLVECIFILTSFWLSKRSFGKPFHLPSMAQCFVVSNISYYLLNRITSPIGISMLIPVMLGVALSYLTSKLVKGKYKPLYRGMPEELFNETILNVCDKDSDKYKICYDFYIKKINAVKLANKYNYTEFGIRKIKDRINNKIKEL